MGISRTSSPSSHQHPSTLHPKRQNSHARSQQRPVAELKDSQTTPNIAQRMKNDETWWNRPRIGQQFSRVALPNWYCGWLRNPASPKGWLKPIETIMGGLNQHFQLVIRISSSTVASFQLWVCLVLFQQGMLVQQLKNQASEDVPGRIHRPSGTCRVTRKKVLSQAVPHVLWPRTCGLRWFAVRDE